MAKVAREEQLGNKEKVEQYLICILVHLIAPFLPLIIEGFAVQWELSRMQSGISITVAMYAFTISVSSEWPLFLLFGIIMALLVGGVHGVVVNKIEQTPLVIEGCVILSVLIFAIHAIERYRRHIHRGEIFFNFNFRK